MAGRRKFFIITILILGGVYLGGGYYFSNQIIAFKTKTQAEDKRRIGIEGPADYGLPEPQTVEVEGYEGVRLAGFFFDNPRRKDARCAVIIQHGFTGTRWGALKFAPLFWKRGCHIVAMDARYHGKSGGVYGTLGFFERYDMQRVLAWTAERTGLPRARIGLMGVSMGGVIVLLTAALEPDIAFVAADAPYSDLGTILSERARILYSSALLPLVPIAFVIAEARAGFDIEEVSPYRQAPSIQAPVFLSRSDTDVYTPPYHTVKIHEHLDHDRALLFKTDWGSEHGKCIDDDRERYEANLNRFLETHVPDFGR